MREDHLDHDQDDIPHTTDDAFEVTSLRPPAPDSGRQLRSVAPGRLRPLRRLAGRMSARGWRRLAAGAALIVTLAIILGMIPGVAQGIAGAFGPSRPAQTTPAPSGQSGFLSLTLTRGPTGPTPTPNPTPDTATSPYPADCPDGITTMSSATPFTGTAGAGPVWFGSFKSLAGQPAAVQLTDLVSPVSQYGRPIQAVLFIRSDTHGPVTLSGVNVNGGRPLWFSFVAIGNGRDPTPGAKTPATEFSFTPQRPSPGVPTFWYASYGTLYLPGAGCYAVSAHWPGGGWRVTFAAGS